ncbi:uncharacterized protein LOC126311218 isoform X2 [Schistocerca gregaria]|uniref:uncharacterized protein LOC126311218 isoform X2 n=1 Tax=Schistocerca gregaria TaxID=7010 RepID=UPI00211DBF10|nr:uncharacterized protein LOC126311218 isoform X2 [Schistocerca gregaria]
MALVLQTRCTSSRVGATKNAKPVSRAEVTAHLIQTFGYQEKPQQGFSAGESGISDKELERLFDMSCASCENYILELIGTYGWDLEKVEQFLTGKNPKFAKVRYCEETIVTSLLNVQNEATFDQLTRSKSNKTNQLAKSRELLDEGRLNGAKPLENQTHTHTSGNQNNSPRCASTRGAVEGMSEGKSERSTAANLEPKELQELQELNSVGGESVPSDAIQHHVNHTTKDGDAQCQRDSPVNSRLTNKSNLPSGNSSTSADGSGSAGNGSFGRDGTNFLSSSTGGSQAGVAPPSGPNRIPQNKSKSIFGFRNPFSFFFKKHTKPNSGTTSLQQKQAAVPANRPNSSSDNTAPSIKTKPNPPPVPSPIETHQKPRPSPKQDSVYQKLVSSPPTSPPKYTPAAKEPGATLSVPSSGAPPSPLEHLPPNYCKNMYINGICAEVGCTSAHIQKAIICNQILMYSECRLPSCPHMHPNEITIVTYVNDIKKTFVELWPHWHFEDVLPRAKIFCPLSMRPKNCKYGTNCIIKNCPNQHLVPTLHAKNSAPSKPLVPPFIHSGPVENLLNVTHDPSHHNLVLSIMKGQSKGEQTLRILKLELIHNPQLDKQYNDYFIQVKRRNMVRPTEIYAFHGTSEPSIKEITTHGFDVSLVKRAIHGYGIYCALDPNVAITYCRGGNKMLMVRLITDGLKWIRKVQYYVVPNSAGMNPLYIITFASQSKSSHY